MNLEEIKQALIQGKKVCWSNDGYEVIGSEQKGYLIQFIPNGHCIGLTWADGVTLNGKESEFYVKE